MLILDEPIDRRPLSTDAGLKEIAKMQKLRSLHLGGTKITNGGVAELKKAMPKCKISHYHVK